MDDVKEYILTIIALAFIGGIILNVIDKKSTHGKIIKLLVSLIIAVAAVSPLVRIQLSDFSYVLNEINADGDDLAAAGNQLTQDSIHAIIKEQTEAYILEKASTLDANISVRVCLSDDEHAIPLSVIIKGNVSPYAKERLTCIIAADLGISEENQAWE